MRVLGLDLGTKSVGWALVTTPDDGETPSLEAGVYVFPEVGPRRKDELLVSDRAERGQKRRARRNLARRRHRRNQLVAILTRNGMLPEDATEWHRLFNDHVDATGADCHPYALRARGLDHPLTLPECGRALFHISRRRGYLSTAILMKRTALLSVSNEFAERVSAGADAEEAGEAEEAGRGKGAKEDAEDARVTLKRIEQIRARLKEHGMRTVGEYQAHCLANREPVRGVGGKRAERNPQRDKLGVRGDRAMFESEFDMLWDSQARFHPLLRSGKLRKEVYDAIFFQNDLRPQRYLSGTCEFYPARRCVQRASLLFQQCEVLMGLANLRIDESPAASGRRKSAARGRATRMQPVVAESSGQAAALRGLTPGEIALLAAELDQRDHLTFAQARALIGLPDARFTDELTTDARGRATRSRHQLVGNRTQSAMRRALGAAWSGLDADRQEDLVTRLVTCQSAKAIAKGLRRDFGLSDDLIYAALQAQLPSGNARHCTRTLKEIRPFLELGYDYARACELAGLREANTSTEAPVQDFELLPPIADLRNPVVNRSVQAARRVINAVILRYGKPDAIRIEMTREVSLTNEQRKEIWEAQERNARENERARKLLREFGLPEGQGGRNIKKVRLWWEAGGRCPYLPDAEVSLEALIQDYDIDHIVPESRCYDSSLRNLTICPHDVNVLQKGNRTPFEVWGGQEHWQRIEAHVAGLHSMRPDKRKRILSRQCDEQDFTNRALSDTGFISRQIRSEVRKLGVEPQVTRGRMTDLLRRAWGLSGLVEGDPAEMSEQERARYEARREKMQAWQRKGVKKAPKPRFDHRHHAVDAVVTALLDRRTLAALTRYLQRYEAGAPRGEIERPLPWPTLCEDMKAALERMVVVHQPQRGVRGALHKDTALKRNEWPSQADVEKAVDALPEARRRRVSGYVVVGGKLVRRDEAGRITQVYALENNHHAVIWERDHPTKGVERDMTVVAMIEASWRADHREPVINQQRPGWRFVMALCKRDIVECGGDRPGLRRVAQISAPEGGKFELQLALLTEADAESKTRWRVRGESALHHLIRRVGLSPLGEIIHSEPGAGGGGK